MNGIKWLTGAVYGAVLIVAYIYHGPIIEWMKGGGAPAPVMVLLAAGLAFFPIVPYGVVIGALGYIYGSLTGTLISLTGAWIAAVLMYVTIRYLFRESGRAWIGKISRLDGFVRLTERHPFLSILLARLVPVIPQYAINAYAAVTGIRSELTRWRRLWARFRLYWYTRRIGHNLTSHPGRIVLLVLIYLAFMGLVLLFYRRLTAVR